MLEHCTFFISCFCKLIHFLSIVLDMPLSKIFLSLLTYIFRKLVIVLQQGSYCLGLVSVSVSDSWFCLSFSVISTWNPFGNCKPGVRTISPPPTSRHLPIFHVSSHVPPSLSLIHTTCMMSSYLYLVTKQWRNTAICSLVKSVPTQNLMPPPKAIKFFDAPFWSILCLPIHD